MPRANRYLLSGQLYHVTHRCHDRSFLLKFAKDRNEYRRLAIEMAREGGQGLTFLYIADLEFMKHPTMGRTGRAAEPAGS